MPYTPTDWSQGSVITVTKMNKIETELQKIRADLDQVLNITEDSTDNTTLDSRINNMVHVDTEPLTAETGLLDNKIWINPEFDTIEIPTWDELKQELAKKVNALGQNYNGENFSTKDKEAIPLTSLTLLGQSDYITTDGYSNIQNIMSYNRCLYIQNFSQWEINTDPTDAAVPHWNYNTTDKSLTFRWAAASDEKPKSGAIIQQAIASNNMLNYTANLNILKSNVINIRLSYYPNGDIGMRVILPECKNLDDDAQVIALYQQYFQHLPETYIWYQSPDFTTAENVYTVLTLKSNDVLYGCGTLEKYPPLLQDDQIDLIKHTITYNNDYIVMDGTDLQLTTNTDKWQIETTKTYGEIQKSASGWCNSFNVAETGDTNTIFRDSRGKLIITPPLDMTALTDIQTKIQTAYTSLQPVKLVLTRKNPLIIKDVTFTQDLSTFPANTECLNNLQLTYYSIEAEALAESVRNLTETGARLTELEKQQQTLFYVSATGDDQNKGDTPDTAKATINSALESGAETIFISEGTYTEQIDLSKSHHNKLELYHYNPQNYLNKKVTFIPQQYKIDGVTLVKGNVYSLEITNSYLLDLLMPNTKQSDGSYKRQPSALNWLFQENVADLNTIINRDAADDQTSIYTDRYSLQKGRKTRCLEKRLTRMTAEEVLAYGKQTYKDTDIYEAEIEWLQVSNMLNNGELLETLRAAYNNKNNTWFCCSSNDGAQERWFLYLCSADTINETQPICCTPIKNMDLFILDASQYNNFSLIVDGINVKYQRFNLNHTINSYITNCTASNVYGTACFSYNGATNVVLKNCEASRAYWSSNHGDGISAAGTKDRNDQPYDASSIHLIDCWSHDNLDDGFSDHQECKSTIDGGLFEYNSHGGGVTPSTGSFCVCRNAIARKNGEAGFLYLNRVKTVSNIEGAQFECYNCVSEDNGYWGEADKSLATKIVGGFKVDSLQNNSTADNIDAYNIARFINCTAINEIYGFISERQSEATLINCYTSGCDNQIYIGTADTDNQQPFMQTPALVPVYKPEDSMQTIQEQLKTANTQIDSHATILTEQAQQIEDIQSELTQKLDSATQETVNQSLSDQIEANTTDIARLNAIQSTTAPQATLSGEGSVSFNAPDNNTYITSLSVQGTMQQNTDENKLYVYSQYNVKETFNSAEGWVLNNSNITYFSHELAYDPLTTQLLASYGQTGIDELTTDSVMITSSQIYLNIQNINNLDALNTYLQANPLTIYYKDINFDNALQVYLGFKIHDNHGYRGFAVGPISPLVGYNNYIDTLDFFMPQATYYNDYYVLDGVNITVNKPSTMAATQTFRTIQNVGETSRTDGKNSHYRVSTNSSISDMTVRRRQGTDSKIDIRDTTRYEASEDYNTWLQEQVIAHTPVKGFFNRNTPFTQTYSVIAPIAVQGEVSIIIDDVDGNLSIPFSINYTASFNSVKQQIDTHIDTVKTQAHLEHLDFLRCFTKFCGIGDSLMGGFTQINANTNISTADARQAGNNWFTYLMMRLNRDGVNLAVGSSSTRIWRGKEEPTHKTVTADIAEANIENIDCYIVGLGVNDLLHGVPAFSSDTAEMTGLELDKKADYNDNADTTRGNLDFILHKLSEYNPFAKIFVLQVPWYNNQDVTVINQVIEEVCSWHNNTYCINLNSNNDFMDSFLLERFYGGHFDPIAYNWISVKIEQAINNYIYTHSEDFKFIPYKY